MSKLFQFIKIIRPGDAFIIISFLAIIFWAISRSWNMPSGQYLKIESNYEDPVIFSLNQSANKNISKPIAH